MQGADAVILAVAHSVFCERGAGWIGSLLRRPARGCVLDVKSVFRKEDFPDVAYWRL